MKFGELKTGAETVTPNWVYDALGELTLASDMKVLAFLARHRLYQHSTFRTWEIAGKTGLDLRTVQASTRRLGEAGYILSADGEHCLRGACAKPAQPLHKSTRVQTRPEQRQDGKKRPLEVKEVKEEKEQEQEREYKGGKSRLPEHALSEKEEGREGEVGRAFGAGAPGGAYQAPDRPFIVRFQPTANARNDGATSPEDVPPGAAAGGGGLALSPPGATRTALEIAFGPAFLAQLLGEGGARQGWLSLDAGRVAELHQAALDSSGPRPWRTRFISQLDLEVTGRGKRSRDLTAEEWIA